MQRRHYKASLLQGSGQVEQGEAGKGEDHADQREGGDGGTGGGTPLSQKGISSSHQTLHFRYCGRPNIVRSDYYTRQV